MPGARPEAPQPLDLDDTGSIPPELLDGPDASSTRAPGLDAGPLPRRFKNYELLEEIGRGGMGIVYRARQVELDRQVALKLIRFQVPRSHDLVRFVAEAQATGQLEHPNVVPVHEIGTDPEGRPFFVMKYVRGRSLAQIMSARRKGDEATRHAFPLERMLEIVAEACQGVAFAHSKGLLHRDLKPSNIMVGDYGEVLVMDWGLALPLSAYRPQSGKRGKDEVRMVMDAHGKPKPGATAGTPEYMSPEQASADHERMGPRSDIYSLGAILFEILAQHAPHSDPDTRALLRKISLTPAAFPEQPHPRAEKPNRALRAVTLKALALEPEDRYASALDLRDDLRNVLQDRPVRARPDGPLEYLGRTLRRNAVLAGTIALALVALSLGAAAASFQLRQSALARAREAEKRREAEQEAIQREREMIALEQQNALKERENQETKKKLQGKEAEADYASHMLREQNERLQRAIPLYLRALDLLERRKWELALAELEQVIEAYPFSMMESLVYYHKGVAWRELGDPRKAIVNFEQADRSAREHRPGAKNARALFQCGDLALRMLNDPAQAEAYFKRAAQDPGEDPYALLAEAWVHVLRARQENQPDARRKAASAALAKAEALAGSRKDFLWEAFHLAGRLLGGLELQHAELLDLDRAREYLGRAQDLEPARVRVTLDLAAVRLAQARQAEDPERWLQCLEEYQRALRLEPSLAEAHGGRGLALARLGRHDEAIESLSRALHMGWTAPAGRYQLAELLHAKGQLAEARSLLVELSKEWPAEPSYRLLLTDVWLALGQPEDAIQAATWLIQREHFALKARELRARAYQAAEQPLKAAADYLALLDQARAYPDAWRAWRGLGYAWHAGGEPKKAVAAWETYLEHEPEQHAESVEIMHRILDILLQPGMARDPPRAVAWSRRGEEFVKKHGLEGEAAFRRREIEALLSAGQRAEAEQRFQAFYTDFPGYEGLRELKRAFDPKP